MQHAASGLRPASKLRSHKDAGFSGTVARPADAGQARSAALKRNHGAAEGGPGISALAEALRNSLEIERKSILPKSNAFRVRQRPFGDPPNSSRFRASGILGLVTAAAFSVRPPGVEE